MYNYIYGTIAEITPSYVVVDNHGIGYLIEISLNTYTQIKDLKEVKLLIHYVVREDAHLLFGFYEESERSLFRQLINVSGVGVATARVMLSTLNTAELTQAIVSENVKMVQSIKGIGAKSAQRVILELKDKVVKGGGSDTPALFSPSSNPAVDEATTALVMLGFTKANVNKAVSTVLKGNPSASLEDIIKQSLKLL